jgi:hypothetical protein
LPGIDFAQAYRSPSNFPIPARRTELSKIPLLIRVSFRRLHQQARELRYRITAKGMRTRTVTIATTLLDPLR